MSALNVSAVNSFSGILAPTPTMLDNSYHSATLPGKNYVHVATELSQGVAESALV